MKKFLFMAATAALVMSSCSNEELMQVETPSVNDGAITFSAYEGRATRTASDDPAALKALGKVGFGVFAYEQGRQDYDAYIPTHITPNFMYNQQVQGYTSGNALVNGTEAIHHWAYTPVKYWPNNGDKVSFFAYAPYSADINMVWLGSNNGPAIEYTFDAHNGVDLLYALAFTNKTKPYLDNIIEVDDGSTSTAANDKMQFQFKHALAKVSFNIQMFVDEATDATCGTPTGDAVDGNTTITVKSLKLNGKFATTGTMKLLNGSWSIPLAETQSIELLSNPITLGNNKTEQTFDDLTDLLLIPLASDDKFSIIITYEVKTGEGANQSVVTNVVESTGDGYELKQSYAYEYHLNLGMETVRFDAKVTGWDSQDAVEVALPENNNTPDPEP